MVVVLSFNLVTVYRPAAIALQHGLAAAGETRKTLPTSGLPYLILGLQAIAYLREVQPATLVWLDAIHDSVVQKAVMCGANARLLTPAGLDNAPAVEEYQNRLIALSHSV